MVGKHEQYKLNVNMLLCSLSDFPSSLFPPYHLSILPPSPTGIRLLEAHNANCFWVDYRLHPK